MSKRGYTLAQTVVTMVILSLVVLSITTLTYKVQSQKSDNTDRQILQVVNINKIEELNQELNSTGVLPIGNTQLNLSYGFKPCKMEVTIDGSEFDHTYYVKIASRLSGKQSRTVTSEVILSLGAKYE